MPEESAQPTQVDKIQTSKSLSKHFKLNWIHVAIAAVFGTAILVAGAWLLVLSDSEQGDESSDVVAIPVNKATPSSESTPSAEKESEETADWKTYTDPKGKYSIKYPFSWKQYIDENNLVHFSPQGQDDNRYLYYVVEVTAYSENENFNDLVQKSYGQISPEVTSKNNRKVAKAVVQGHPDKFYSVLLDEEGNYAWFVFGYNSNNKDSQEKFIEDSLSTFKFLD